ATLSYKLSRPARVHIQAGVAKIDPKTKQAEGPVLKTVVNREPRPAGAVVEAWNGLDEAGSSYVPDLPDFVVNIVATSLPENAIPATGNRSAGFLAAAVSRTGESLIPAAPVSHEHHLGLDVFHDTAPRLVASPLNASWSPPEKAWTLAAKT